MALFKIIKIMNELFTYLEGLSFGEFIVIWISTIILLFFHLFLLYFFIRIKKDTNILKIKIKRTLDLLDIE